MKPWEEPGVATAEPMKPWDMDGVATEAKAPKPWDDPEVAQEYDTRTTDQKFQDNANRSMDEAAALTIGAGQMQPEMQLAQEPLPELQQPNIQMPPVNISAAEDAQRVAGLAGMQRRREDTELNAQSAAASGGSMQGEVRDARAAEDTVRETLRLQGMEEADIDRRLGDLRAMDFTTATRGMPRARTLSDGRLAVDPALAFDAAAWNAAVDGSSASDVEKENAKDYRTQLRDELAQQIISPLRSASGEFAEELEAKKATQTPGEIVESWKLRNSGAFDNLWDQFGIGLSQGKAQLGKALMGAVRIATFDTLPGNLGEGFADDANWHAQRRAALSGGQWAGDLTATVVGTVPAVGVGMGTSSFPAMLATAGGQTAGDTFVSARQAGWSPLEAAGAALVQGGIEAGITASFGRTGIESVAGRASEQGLVRRVVTQGAAEVPEEVAITMLQAPMNEAIQPGSMDSLPQQIRDTAWQSFVIGGGVAALNGKPSEPQAKTATATTSTPAGATAATPAAGEVNFETLKADLDAIANEDGDEDFGSAPLPQEPTIWKPAPDAPPPPPTPVAPDENFARETSFPRGLLQFVTPEEAGELMATKEGPMRISALRNLMTRASERRQAATPPAQPAATGDVQSPPAEAAPAPIAPDVQAQIAADPIAETDATTDNALDSSSTKTENNRDTSHLTALEESLSREIGRRESAVSQEERSFRDIQISLKRKEIAQEREFLGLPPEVEMNDAELLAQLGVELIDATNESAPPQADPMAEGALHERETELLRRLESKRRETRENAERELMSRAGLPWTNQPDQAEKTAQFTAQLRERVKEREARWTNEADQLAEDAGIEITADNIPFSQNKIDPAPIANAVRETMEMLGVGTDIVTTEVVDDVESIEDAGARKAATASKKAGNNIRAYYVAGRDGQPSRVVINASGVRTPEQARIAVLHEVAGHHGLRVLFTKQQGKWRGIVDRLFNRLSNGELSQDVQRETGVKTLRELQALYHRPDVGMNYDPTTVEGRSNLIEEVLATMAPFAKKPAWYQSILSELKTLLNRVTGGILGRSFTDADVNVLLAKARRAAKRGTQGRAGVKMSQASDRARKPGESDSDYNTRLAAMNGTRTLTLEQEKQQIDEARADSKRVKSQAFKQRLQDEITGQGVMFSQEVADRDARSVQRALEASAEDLKESQTQRKLKADPNTPDAVKQMLNGLYATYSDVQALRDAQAWMDKDGADEVERTLMGGQRAQLDGRDVAAVKLIGTRLSTLGLTQRYADFMRAVMAKMTTQAQGLQKMHLLFDTTTPEGALAFFQKEVEKVVDQLSNKNKEQARIIQGMLGMLEQFKADAATSRIVIALRTIATSADLTPARKAEVQEKMRKALLTDDGTDATRLRLRGLFIAAGVEQKTADKMAVQLLKKFRDAQKRARAQVIKQLLKVPKIVKRIPKGQFAKWEKLNDEGALSDAKMFGAIANKFGFPVFTSEDAATIRGFFDRYKAATEPELKFVQAAKLLEWIEERTNPAGVLEKAGALYKLTKLASFKTIERNFLGNLTFAIARTAGIDVPMWIGEKGISLFTGKRVSPLRTALGNMWRGQEEVNRIYRIGRDYAVSQGEGGMKAVRAGFDTLLTAARYHMAGYRDAAGLKNIHRSVFSSAAGRMFEKVMHAAITLPDLGRFYGEVNAELARLMDVAGPGTTLPTAEMFEAAYLHAQRELYQNNGILAEAAGKLVKAMNVGWERDPKTGKAKYKAQEFGFGTVIAPFVRVPVNILAEGATWSPLGVVRALFNAGIDKDPRRAVQNAMKAVIGTGALIPAGAWLYGLGIITAAFDEDKEIADVQRASGMQKYAVNLSMLRRRMLSGNWHTKEEPQEGDVLVSYAWAQPMAFSLAAGAEMQRRHDRAVTTDEPWWTRKLVQPAESGFSAFMEQPLVTGLSAFSTDLMQARQSGNYEALLRLPIRALDFVPAIVRDVRYFNDNALPETRSADVIAGEFSRMLGGVPGVDLPQRYNVLGEAEERYQAASNTVLNTFFNPAMTTFVRKHPVASEVLRLAEQTGEKSVAPARVNKSVRINTTGMANQSQTLALTNQDVSRLQELQGKLFVELAKLEMTRPDYFRMNDAMRAKSMADAVAASQSAAKSVLFGHRLYSISPEGASMNRDAVRAVLIGKAAGIIP